ncbi:MAG: nickel pincer cofactor biosynthesis protein LarC [Lentisphaeria bacterium]|nr:nickel pincer cofactor biosynthesis protein LarC [Lentisphaeria bacterium]
MNNNILFLEGRSGIAGDMAVAALLDLGGSREKLERGLTSLGLAGVSWEITAKKAGGIAGCDFRVLLDGHDDHHHHHHHEHGGHHHHEHRNLADIEAILDRGELAPGAVELAKKIFRIVAEAEAAVHGTTVEECHFHEVGAWDSIIDIAAFAILYDDLGIDRCVVTGLTEGCGTVRCQHGELPVPVPAVLKIASQYNIPFRFSGNQGEMVTPTGIAIAAACRTGTELPPSAVVSRVGIGIGKRVWEHTPNLLRAMLLRLPERSPGQIMVIETNLDDSTGEMLGHAMEQLFAAGALDVHYMPCQMKKNRPGWLLRVIAAETAVPALEETVFRCTSAIGLRRYPVERTCMERTPVPVKLPHGEILVKRCSYGSVVRYYPEYESVRRYAVEHGGDFRTVYTTAEAMAHAALD